MTTYIRDGDAATLKFALTNSPGITPTDAKMFIQNEAGEEVAAETTVAPSAFSPGLVTITVPEASNTLAPGRTNGVRLVSLWVKGPGMTSYALYEQSYAIMATEPLTLQVNSFQTYSASVSTALNLPSGEVAAFEKADRLDRVRALEAAWITLVSLKYTFGRDNIDRFKYVTDFPSGTPGDLALLTPAEFLELPERFIAALRRAQVIEADSLLRADSASDAFASRLVSSKVGEVSQTWRTSKPLELAAHRRTYKYLTGYVNHNPTLSRH